MRPSRLLSNPVTYLQNIITLCETKKREELKLPGDHPALVVFDHFKAQCTSNVLQILRNNHIDTLLIPASCTDCLQLLDVSVNKVAKEFLHRQIHLWYAGEVCHQLRQGSSIKLVDTCMSVVKPLGAKWLIKMYDNITSKVTLKSLSIVSRKPDYKICIQQRSHNVHLCLQCSYCTNINYLI